MKSICPTVADEGVLCVETPAPACGVVVFGASGDLAQRKLLPALVSLFDRGLLNEDFFCLGCGRKELSDDDFRKTVAANSQSPEFLNRFYYASGDYNDSKFYSDIKQRISDINKKNNSNAGVIFYLSLPPFLYPDVIENLGKSGLNKSQTGGFVRIVVEKPFGRDLQTALELNDCLGKWFAEEQIYRIDHYLGKETVQNILMFRFANSIFEPLWNRNYIDHIQITIAESLGVEGRGSYYDKSGAIRDMFQNHLLSMLSLVAMEPPASFEAERIRDEKVQLLRSIRPPVFEPWNEDIVFGQYSAGEITGKKVCGYQQEKDVAPQSKTETYAAARLFIDNWRWRDVPFYLRTGKRLPRRVTEIAIVFKKPPHTIFASAGIQDLPANVLVLKIQPDEGIGLFFEAKRPGSKLCMGTLAMDFNYADVFAAEPPDAYQRLLLDCMAGDQTLFTRIDDVKLAWGLVDRVLADWQQRQGEPYFYQAGAESFSQADALIQKDGRSWRKISEM
ncbi:MAG: glucose-6-phosphate dehydrogenase [Phycisphaerae bacterium]|jgi:glucose-6-phosphate 1-dehydrogenase